MSRLQWIPDDLRTLPLRQHGFVFHCHHASGALQARASIEARLGGKHFAFRLQGLCCNASASCTVTHSAAGGSHSAEQHILVWFGLLAQAHAGLCVLLQLVVASCMQSVLCARDNPDARALRSHAAVTMRHTGWCLTLAGGPSLMGQHTHLAVALRSTT